MRLRWRGAVGACVLGLLAGCVPAGGEGDDEDPEGGVRDVGGVLGGDDAFRPLPVDDMGPPGSDGGPGADGGGDVDVPVIDAETPGPGDPDCATLAACLQACDNADCSRACRARAPAESSARYDAIFACAREQGCTEPGAPPNRECMEARCAEVELACYGDGPLPPVGDLDCAGLRVCAEACRPNDDACRDGCDEAATPAAATAYAAVERCRLTSGCPPADVLCFEDACAAELANCEGAPIDPEGDPACEALVACINECDQDQACADACAAGSTPAARELYNAAVTCLQDAAAQCPVGDTECQNQLCQRQIVACVGEGVTPGGAGTCAEFDDCLGLCPQGNQACVDACVAEASAVGYGQYVDLVDCVQMSCPQGSTPSCGVLACEPLFEACFGPVPAPRGALGCIDFNECLSFCADGDQPCFDRCIEQASPRGYDLLLIAINCIEDAGCAPGDAVCQDVNCGDQINACFNDF
ncbi:MAG: hypothetical protein H6701_10050 [Myxococcales bacterium]|nr:hypothetical protein [Myxococcales bacterium]